MFIRKSLLTVCTLAAVAGTTLGLVSAPAAAQRNLEDRCIRVVLRSVPVWYDCNPAIRNCGSRDWTADYDSAFIVERDRDNALFVKSYRYPDQFGWLWRNGVRTVDRDYCN